MSDSETPVPPQDPDFTPPAPPPPEPEPIFIAEQTPIPPSPDPVVPPAPAGPPPTTQLPVTPAAGIPASGEPTTMMPPTAVINPGVPVAPGGPGTPIPPGGMGPGGPMGPGDVPPEKPWYQQPGPIAIITLIVLLLIALLVWLFTGDDGSDDDIVIDTTISDTSTSSTLPTDSTTIPPETTLPLATTLPPATTAAPETTSAPTTAAPTTATPTTAAPTTTSPPTTVAPTTTTTIPDIIPEPGETLWDVIERDSDLSVLKELIELAGLQDALNDPDATFTIFAPSNAALEEAFGENPEDMDEELLQNLLLAHVHEGEAFPEAALLALNEVSVMFGGPQQIDKNASPPTVGGAPIVVEAPPAENGILYVISRVMQPVAD